MAIPPKIAGHNETSLATDCASSTEMKLYDVKGDLSCTYINQGTRHDQHVAMTKLVTNVSWCDHPSREACTMDHDYNASCLLHIRVVTTLMVMGAKPSMHFLWDWAPSHTFFAADTFPQQDSTVPKETKR